MEVQTLEGLRRRYDACVWFRPIVRNSIIFLVFRFHDGSGGGRRRKLENLTRLRRNVPIPLSVYLPFRVNILFLETWGFLKEEEFEKKSFKGTNATVPRKKAVISKFNLWTYWQGNGRSCMKLMRNIKKICAILKIDFFFYFLKQQNNFLIGVMYYFSVNE